MNAFNDQYNEEIMKIVRENPRTYFKMLTSHGYKGRHPDKTYLLEYVKTAYGGYYLRKFKN